MCTLRAYGKQFDVDAFVKKSKLKPCVVYHRGEPKSKTNPNKSKWTASGINVPVSDAEFDNFKQQINDAIQFLTKNKEEIRKFINIKEVEGLELDFPTSHNRDKFIQNYLFPTELIALAFQLGLELKISEYPESDE